ncbi:MAG TPA: response regulator [Chthoniobacter sp.]|nr:response regulator [Chthoniobacter sp.]
MNTAAAAEMQIVHIVEDDESLRTATSRLLRAAGYEVRTYASAGEFALAREATMSGCVLLDVRMPGPSGLDLQDSLARSSNPLPIIFLTGHGDIPMSVRAMKAGAVDFLTKPVERSLLLAAVESALARGSQERSGRASLRAWRERFESLSPREREVFERVTMGQPNKQIAGEIDAAERTVKAHRARVMEKMGAASLAELVHIAEELRRAE